MIDPAWDLVGIIGTGQSLSVGDQGTPFNATEQPYENLKLSLGAATVPPYDAANSELSLVPLIEPIRPTDPSYPSAYPGNLDGESPHTAMANQITALARAAGGDYVTVHSVVGESGQPMTVIEKGAADTGVMGRAFAATLFEAEAIGRLAEADGRTYGIGAIVITHGESDAGNTSYASDLFQLWSDYNEDLRAITGQTEPIPMLVSQQHSVPEGAGSRSPSTLAQWQVGLDYPGDLICSGPKYHYPYAADHVHLLSEGYDRLGEKYGQVYFERAVLGNDWQPLQPTSVERDGNTVRVRFHVPVPPLVWDETLPDPHQTAYTEWAAGSGFELYDGNTRIAIDSVTIEENAVLITAAAALPASVTVGYAITADGVPMDGGTTRWGRLRDSDPFVGSTTGVAQPNYAVSFEMAVP